MSFSSIVPDIRVPWKHSAEAAEHDRKTLNLWSAGMLDTPTAARQCSEHNHVDISEATFEANAYWLGYSRRR